MAIPILHFWKRYFTDPDEGLGSSYERVVINRRIESVCRMVEAKTVLEAPSFGFTGLSGINSLDLAQKGYEITLADHDPERLELIEETWANVGQNLKTTLLPNYETLPYADGAFDVAWNFSALWFVNDLDRFLIELTRVTRKAIVLMVPNRSGLGYRTQKLQGAKELRTLLHEENIDPIKFRRILKTLGWNLLTWDFIDCPPWPDIGMPKEKFLGKFGIRLPERPHAPLTIMDYYHGNDPAFPQRMARYEGLEKYAPKWFKEMWAHHRYYIFLPQSPDAK